MMARVRGGRKQRQRHRRLSRRKRITFPKPKNSAACTI